jgi:hypothetical protein
VTVSALAAEGKEKNYSKSEIHDSWDLRAGHGQENALLMRFTNENVVGPEASRTIVMRNELSTMTSHDLSVRDRLGGREDRVSQLRKSERGRSIGMTRQHELRLDRHFCDDSPV